MPEMPESLDWSGLDDAVKKATSRVKGLREENRALRRDVKKLSQQLKAKKTAATASSSGLEQKSEIRERLEALETNLESLLG